MINELLKYKYIKSNISKKWLIENGFRYDKLLSTEKDTYVYNFSVHKYKKYSVLTCRLSIDLNSGIVGIDVYHESGELYHPFYFVSYGDFKPLLDPVNKKIYKKLKELGIRRIMKSCK